MSGVPEEQHSANPERSNDDALPKVASNVFDEETKPGVNAEAAMVGVLSKRTVENTVASPP